MQSLIQSHIYFSGLGAHTFFLQVQKDNFVRRLTHMQILHQKLIFKNRIRKYLQDLFDFEWN